MANRKIYENAEESLMRGAILSVANEGLENTTVRSIGGYAGVNNALIFRYYENKDDLINKAFLRENTNFIYLWKAYLIEMQNSGEDLSKKERNERFFNKIWDFFISNPEVCVFCNYYYHSGRFIKLAAEEHEGLVNNIIENLEYLFTKDSGINKQYLYFLVEIIFMYSVRIIHGETENTPEKKKSVFEMIYKVIGE